MITDLLQEVAAKNHVRVVKYEARRSAGHRTIHKRVMDEQFDGGVAFAPALVLADSLRMMSGRKPVYLREALRRMGGLRLVDVTANLRTTVGINFCASNLAGTDGGQVIQADYLAISNNTSTPAVGDSSSTLPWSTGSATDGTPGTGRGEWTGLGLSRKVGSLAHTAGATTYTNAATWTATGTSTGTQMAGMFGGAGRTTQGSGATNILFLENTFTATSLVTNDQLSLTWTVNI